VTHSSLSRARRTAERPGARLLLPLETCATFPGIPVALSAVRRIVASAAAGCPRAEDLVLIACEYATNTIRHSPSGQHGGEFTVRVQLAPGWARLEVGDSGDGDWAAAPPDPAAESGRGLIVVAALADKYGHQRGCAWAEVTCPSTL
jgi:anti-sigma regulatory factor (Ser/Thr protein kinase)